MVKHVESADEFDALKKASKPVRPFLFSLSSLREEARDAIDRRRIRARGAREEVFLSRSLFVIFPQPTFKKEKNETHTFARDEVKRREASFVPTRARRRNASFSLSFSLVS
jgi:hypothetical protein